MDAAPNAVLEWNQGALGAECARAEVVKRSVETYLGRSVFTASGDVVIRVTLKRLETPGARPQIVATVNQRDRGGKSWGERNVAGDADCASLDEPLTLVVALMVDSPIATETAATRPTPLPPPPPNDTSDESSQASDEIQTAPSLARALEAPAHAAVLALGGASLGMLPDPSSSFGLALLLKPKHFWGIAFEAHVAGPTQRALGTGSATSYLLLAQAGLCPLQGESESAWWAACAGFAAGRLSVASHDLIGARRHHDWLWVPNLDLRAAWRLHRRWLIGGGMTAAFPLSADRYRYRDAEGGVHEAFQLSSFGLTTSLGLGLLFD